MKWKTKQCKTLLRFSQTCEFEFKSQMTIAFFSAVNHLNGPIRKRNFT